MKDKIVTIILSTTIVACIGLSIYQYQTTLSLKDNLALLENNKSELAVEIESKTQELSNITFDIEETNNMISELTNNVETLTVSTKDIQSEIDTLQSEIKSLEEKKAEEKSKNTTGVNNSTSSSFSDSFIDSIADKIVADYMAEHPEQFNGTAYQEGDYEHVGTPSTGELPTYTLGESGSSGIAPGIIY